MPQPNERAAASLRLDGPGLGLGLDPDEVDAYLDAVDAGLIVQETSSPDNHPPLIRAALPPRDGGPRASPALLPARRAIAPACDLPGTRVRSIH